MKTKLLAAVAIACTAATGPLFAGTMPEQFTVSVLRGEMSVVGPDGNHYDTIVPANYVIKVGVPVHLTIINYDEGPHTMTSKGLGIDIQVKAGHEQSNGDVTPGTTEATFTPTAKGNFRWHCTLPFDRGGKFWAMSKGYDGPDQDGYMAGYFFVM